MRLIDAYWATLQPTEAELRAELDARLQRRKSARTIANPHKRGWFTRAINGACK